MRNIILIAHDIRSTHNVGSLLRTADGLNIEKMYMTGYTPYPREDGDTRLPFIVDKLHKQIQKTALGAEDSTPWEYREDLKNLIKDLAKSGYQICALEQSELSVPLNKYQPPDKVALIIGNEVAGVDDSTQKLASVILEIPMFGKKESFNVANAAAMALFHIRFNN